MALTVISLNVRGLQEVVKRRAIFDFYRTRADILCLQETHSTCKDETVWTNEWGGKAIFSHGNSQSRGTAILVKKGIHCNMTKVSADKDGRWNIVKIEYHNFVFTLINLYAPNSDSPGFFRELITKTDKYSPSLVMIGDYNLALNKDVDRLNSFANNDKAAEYLKNTMEEQYMVDIWRSRNENSRRYVDSVLYSNFLRLRYSINFALII